MSIDNIITLKTKSSKKRKNRKRKLYSGRNRPVYSEVSYFNQADTTNEIIPNPGNVSTCINDSHSSTKKKKKKLCYVDIQDSDCEMTIFMKKNKKSKVRKPESLERPKNSGKKKKKKEHVPQDTLHSGKKEHVFQDTVHSREKKNVEQSGFVPSNGPMNATDKNNDVVLASTLKKNSLTRPKKKKKLCYVDIQDSDCEMSIFMNKNRKIRKPKTGDRLSCDKKKKKEKHVTQDALRSNEKKNVEQTGFVPSNSSTNGTEKNMGIVLTSTRQENSLSSLTSLDKTIPRKKQKKLVCAADINNLIETIRKNKHDDASIIKKSVDTENRSSRGCSIDSETADNELFYFDLRGNSNTSGWGDPPNKEEQKSSTSLCTIDIRDSDCEMTIYNHNSEKKKKKIKASKAVNRPVIINDGGYAMHKNELGGRDIQNSNADLRQNLEGNSYSKKKKNKHLERSKLSCATDVLPSVNEAVNNNDEVGDSLIQIISDSKIVSEVITEKSNDSVRNVKKGVSLCNNNDALSTVNSTKTKKNHELDGNTGNAKDDKRKTGSSDFVYDMFNLINNFEESSLKKKKNKSCHTYKHLPTDNVTFKPKKKKGNKDLHPLQKKARYGELPERKSHITTNDFENNSLRGMKKKKKRHKSVHLSPLPGDISPLTNSDVKFRRDENVKRFEMDKKESLVLDETRVFSTCLNGTQLKEKKRKRHKSRSLTEDMSPSTNSVVTINPGGNIGEEDLDVLELKFRGEEKGESLETDSHEEQSIKRKKRKRNKSRSLPEDMLLSTNSDLTNKPEENHELEHLDKLEQKFGSEENMNSSKTDSLKEESKTHPLEGKVKKKMKKRDKNRVLPEDMLLSTNSDVTIELDENHKLEQIDVLKQKFGCEENMESCKTDSRKEESKTYLPDGTVDDLIQSIVINPLALNPSLKKKRDKSRPLPDMILSTNSDVIIKPEENHQLEQKFGSEENMNSSKTDSLKEESKMHILEGKVKKKMKKLDKSRSLPDDMLLSTNSDVTIKPDENHELEHLDILEQKFENEENRESSKTDHRKKESKTRLPEGTVDDLMLSIVDNPLHLKKEKKKRDKSRSLPEDMLLSTNSGVTIKPDENHELDNIDILEQKFESEENIESSKTDNRKKDSKTRFPEGTVDDLMLNIVDNPLHLKKKKKKRDKSRSLPEDMLLSTNGDVSIKPEENHELDNIDILEQKFASEEIKSLDSCKEESNRHLSDETVHNFMQSIAENPLVYPCARLKKKKKRRDKNRSLSEDTSLSSDTGVTMKVEENHEFKDLDRLGEKFRSEEGMKSFETDRSEEETKTHYNMMHHITDNSLVFNPCLSSTYLKEKKRKKRDKSRSLPQEVPLSKNSDVTVKHEENYDYEALGEKLRTRKHRKSFETDRSNQESKIHLSGGTVDNLMHNIIDSSLVFNPLLSSTGLKKRRKSRSLSNDTPTTNSDVTVSHGKYKLESLDIPREKFRSKERIECFKTNKRKYESKAHLLDGTVDDLLDFKPCLSSTHLIKKNKRSKRKFTFDDNSLLINSDVPLKSERNHEGDDFDINGKIKKENAENNSNSDDVGELEENIFADDLQKQTTYDEESKNLLNNEASKFEFDLLESIERYGRERVDIEIDDKMEIVENNICENMIQDNFNLNADNKSFTSESDCSYSTTRKRKRSKEKVIEYSDCNEDSKNEMPVYDNGYFSSESARSNVSTKRKKLSKKDKEEVSREENMVEKHSTPDSTKDKSNLENLQETGQKTFLNTTPKDKTDSISQLDMTASEDLAVTEKSSKMDHGKKSDTKSDWKLKIKLNHKNDNDSNESDNSDDSAGSRREDKNTSQDITETDCLEKSNGSSESTPVRRSLRRRTVTSYCELGNNTQDESDNVHVPKSRTKTPPEEKHDQTPSRGSTSSKYENVDISYSGLDNSDETDSDASVRESLRRDSVILNQSRSLDGSYEKCRKENDDYELKDLTITLPFGVPYLHALLTRPSLPTPDEYRAIAEAGIVVKSGPFSKAEDNQIKDNWKKFLEVHDLDVSPSAFFTFPKFMKQEQRILFLRFLGHGLDNRLLHRVHYKFKKMFKKSEIKEGRFSKEEDDIILKFVQGSYCKQPFRILARQLNRSNRAILIRYTRLIGKTVQKPLTWSLGVYDYLVNSILEATKTEDINQLKDLDVPMGVWRRISKKMMTPADKLKRTWLVTIHPRLFAENVPLVRVKEKVIEMLYENQVTDWKVIDWKEMAKDCYGFNHKKVYALFSHLMYYHVPKEKHKDLGACVKHLKEYLDHQELPPSKRFKRFVYEDGHLKYRIEEKRKKKKGPVDSSKE